MANCTDRIFSWVVEARPARSASGEIYALSGIRRSRRQTRFLKDGRNVGKAGGVTASRHRLRKRVVDAPRKALGRARATLSRGLSVSDSSDGNDSCISGDNFVKSELPTVSSISHTRPRYWSAAMMFSSSSRDVCGCGWLRLIVSLYRMAIGRGGQQSRVFLTGVPYVQKSRRSSRCCEANTIDRHRRHTCTSVCHCHPQEGVEDTNLQKSNISTRTSSGRRSIVKALPVYSPIHVSASKKTGALT